MSDERIKQKILKLLELGKRSTFPHEAQSAKNQAQNLLRRYNLKEKDLYPRVEKYSVPRSAPWQPPYSYKVNYDYQAEIDALLRESLRYKQHIEDMLAKEERYNLQRRKESVKMLLSLGVVGLLITIISIVSIIIQGK